MIPDSRPTIQSKPDMYELAERRSPGTPKRSDLSLAAEQTDAQRPSAGTLTVNLSSGDEPYQDTAVLSVCGEIDLGTAAVLREALLSVLDRQIGPVVTDLSEVGFMDSTGVHVLVDTLERLKLENRRFAIACPEGGQVHRLLALVGLLDAMAVHRSLESAVTEGDDLLRREAGTLGVRPGGADPQGSSRQPGEWPSPGRSATAAG